MCGILFAKSDTIKIKNFEGALGLMWHRGPDAKPGVYKHNGFMLGHNRLKIIDLDDRSNQPMWSQDGRYVIVFNGEIYNYRELEREFKLNLKTTSDTEVLLDLYMKIGPDMLKLLNGMFSFVILDTETDEYFVARDRLGIKPLYYRRSGAEIMFASEIAPLLRLKDDVDFDEIGVRQYRKLRTFFNGRTLYSGISMFPAGYYMLSGKIQRYWQLPEGEQKPPSDDEIKTLIESAVDYRCISDVPVGSFLSGGLDSTIIAGLASKPHTWTVGFADKNEFFWANLAASDFQSDHFEVSIDIRQFLVKSREIIRKRREPLSVPNETLIYKMSKEIKKKNTVILSGEGADELFWGYDRVFRWAANNNWDLKEFSELYSYGTNDDLGIVEDALSPFITRGKAIDIVASFFQIAHLHGLLRRLDNSTMMCSVEARVPFVDHRLVERMAGVSFSYRMQDDIVKAPLKRIFRDLVNPAIIERVKVGFPVPLEMIPFPEGPCESPMDSWLTFNLAELGVPTEQLIYSQNNQLTDRPVSNSFV